MKSRIYSSDKMKSMSKGQLWIPAFFLFGFLMAFVVTELLMLGNWFGEKNLTMEEIRELYEKLWKHHFLFTGFAVTVCGAVVSSVQSFWYLYSSRKTDFYHSLPVKRSQLFWQRTGIGILYYLVPYLLMTFLAVCIGAIRGLFQIKILALVMMMCFLHLLLYLLIYFCTVLVICITGNILMGALCLGGLMLYGSVFGSLITEYRNIFYKTFYKSVYSTEKYGLLEFLEEYASPYTLGKNLLEQYGGGDYFVLLAAVVCVTALAGGFSYLAFVKRPSESAGKPVVYPRIGIIMKLMVTVPCGLGIGLIFYMLPYNGSRNKWWIFGMVLGTVISHGALEVVYQTNFQKFWSNMHHLILAGILVAACAVNYHKDLLKFDEYFPKKENLAAFHADFGGLNGMNQEIILQNEKGEYRMLGSWSCKEAALTGEHGAGPKTWQVLKKIAEQQSTEKENESCVIPLKYTLKSGREIYRVYHFTSEDLYELCEALYEEGNLKEQQTSFLAMDSGYLKNVDGVFASGERYRLFQEEPEKYQELLNALSEDLEEVGAEELLERPVVKLELEYHLSEKNAAGSSENRGNFSYAMINVNVVPAFERTVAILQKTGYPMSMEEISIEKVNITYFEEENGNMGSAEMTYESEAELRELKKVLVPSGLECAWECTDNRLYAEYYLDGNHQYNYCGNILKESLPDFLQKDMEEAKGQ